MENKINQTRNNTLINPIAVRVSKDGRFLLIDLPGKMTICKPVNYFRAILENIKLPMLTEANS